MELLLLLLFFLLFLNHLSLSYKFFVYKIQKRSGSRFRFLFKFFFCKKRVKKATATMRKTRKTWEEWKNGENSAHWHSIYVWSMFQMVTRKPCYRYAYAYLLSCFKSTHSHSHLPLNGMKKRRRKKKNQTHSNSFLNKWMCLLFTG